MTESSDVNLRTDIPRTDGRQKVEDAWWWGFGRQIFEVRLEQRRQRPWIVTPRRHLPCPAVSCGSSSAGPFFWMHRMRRERKQHCHYTWRRDVASWTEFLRVYGLYTGVGPFVAALDPGVTSAPVVRQGGASVLYWPGERRARRRNRGPLWPSLQPRRRSATSRDDVNRMCLGYRSAPELAGSTPEIPSPCRKIP